MSISSRSSWLGKKKSSANLAKRFPTCKPKLKTMPTSPIARRRKLIGRWNFAPGIARENSSRKSTRRCAESRMAPTATAKRPANRSVWLDWTRGPPRRSAWKPRNAMNVGNGFTATIEILRDISTECVSNGPASRRGRFSLVLPPWGRCRRSRRRGSDPTSTAPGPAILKLPPSIAERSPPPQGEGRFTTSSPPPFPAKPCRIPPRRPSRRSSPPASRRAWAGIGDPPELPASTGSSGRWRGRTGSRPRPR